MRTKIRTGFVMPRRVLGTHILSAFTRTCGKGSGSMAFCYPECNTNAAAYCITLTIQARCNCCVYNVTIDTTLSPGSVKLVANNQRHTQCESWGLGAQRISSTEWAEGQGQKVLITCQCYGPSFLTWIRTFPLPHSLQPFSL